MSGSRGRRQGRRGGLERERESGEVGGGQQRNEEVPTEATALGEKEDDDLDGLELSGQHRCSFWVCALFERFLTCCPSPPGAMRDIISVHFTSVMI